MAVAVPMLLLWLQSLLVAGSMDGMVVWCADTTLSPG